ncbi:gliding motility protein U [Candidatus Magnetomorum sp. HK-1]|nr:gliding motility protein U [Candidatus Magnetomorum sp. HK-1]
MKLNTYLIVVLLFMVTGFFHESVAQSNDKTDNYVQAFSGEKKEEKAFIRKLLKDENKIDLAIKNTKLLIEKSRNKPYLPELYLRLADLYVEKSRISYFIRKALKKQPLTKLEALPSTALKNQSIEVYQRILDHFPDFEQSDKVHFFMAHEFRELGKINQMIVHYREIIKSYPKSPYVPESYLLLGDHYFKSQDLDMAQTHYSEIIKYSDSPAFSIAQYKLGWCHINRAEFKKAIKRFETALKASEINKTSDIDTYKRVDIRLESLTDMAFCYVDCYKKHAPETAIAYFQSFAWSLGSFVTSLEKLAGRYFIKKKWHHSAVIYRKLSELQEDADKQLSYAQKIFECLRETGEYEKANFDVQIIVKALEKQRYSTHIPTKEKVKKEKEYENFAREIITQLHDTARKQKKRKQFEQASDAYVTYLDFFRQSDVFWDMTANCAEALFASENYIKAGQFFEKLYHDAPQKTVDKKEVLFSALTSYYHALKNKDKLNAYEKNYCRQGLLSRGKIFIEAYPKSKDIQDVRFNMAWIAYDEGHYDQAIVQFQSFVEDYPNGRAARAAIHLIMDAFYMKEDFKGLVIFGKNILSNSDITNDELKKEVSTIVSSAEQKIVYSLSLSAIDDWEKGRTQILSVAQKHAGSSLGEKALLALLGPALEKKDLLTFFQTGNRLIENFSDSENHEKTLRLMIQTAMKMGNYYFLAHYLEIFCSAFPKHNDSILFLEQASHIYQQLGAYQKANSLFDQLIYRHENLKPSQIDYVVFQWNENLLSDSLLTDTLPVLKNALPILSQKGLTIARAKLATAFFQLNQTKDAQTIFKKLQPIIKTTKDATIQDALMEMLFFSLSQTHDSYLKCQMSKTLDEKLFQQKQKQFVMLQKGYNLILSYPSPRWVLASCAHLFQIYNDFAQFLRQAPAPNMKESEKKQYMALIEKKAKSYEKNAFKFQKTFVDRAQAWTICDKTLIPFFQLIQTEKKIVKSTFSQKPAFFPETTVFEPSKELIPLYQKRMSEPETLTPLYELAKAYMIKKEWGQAFLLCESGLETDDISQQDQSLLLSIQGLVCLYQKKDRMAQSLFKKALEIDPLNAVSRINFSALLWHYGYLSKSKKLLDKKSRSLSAKDSFWVHSKAR